MAPPTLTFWFEFASPYSMVSALRLFRALTISPGSAEAGAVHGRPSCQLPDLSKVDVVYKPIILGPVFKAAGQKMLPNVQVPIKGRYMFHDIERMLNILDCPGFPDTQPPSWPPNTVLAARMTWLLSQGPEYIHAAANGTKPITTGKQQDSELIKVLAEFVWRVYEAEFIANENIGDPKVIAKLWDRFVVPRIGSQDAVASAQMPDGKRAVDLANSQIVKDGLRSATQEAINHNLFGAPSFTTDDGDMYWGNDRLLDATAHYRIQGKVGRSSGFCIKNKQPNL
ncbi:hypothetical protein IW140_000350 [Coemansia sp. RSA 1813]|nr:hypothetical protein EV178_000692 [Coemansia sp. RSA 1646]KAJ1773222.1 hypothetical protein LPJ74_000732 [Coemansia sp. RSA 1843]KAJ2092690.1 hypothetical protein IW138_000784 [Coemansia sp. RSA 986]KAJ2217813.1 hypothetical protein EV179_000299 [Coemansia sp. RSA 487]KAJ2572952.1 hypothetical protein IW140_000350 [Coemansia sp. RSA 1813]